MKLWKKMKLAKLEWMLELTIPRLVMYSYSIHSQTIQFAKLK